MAEQKTKPPVVWEGRPQLRFEMLAHRLKLGERVKADYSALGLMGNAGERVARCSFARFVASNLRRAPTRTDWQRLG